MSDQYLTVEDVARIMRAKDATVSRWAAKGAIRASKVGGRWLFDEADVRAYVESKVHKPRVAPKAPGARRRRRRSS